MRIEEGEKLSYKSVQLTLTEVKEVFFRENGIHSTSCEVTIKIFFNGKERNVDGSYGTIFEVNDIQFEIKDCATGTRDWNSFVILTILNELK